MTIRTQSFTIVKAFPPDDPLAVDLLRLMAGYNDIVLVVEWLGSNLEEPHDYHEKMWAAGRLDLQIRLLRATMHEILNVLEEMERLRHLSRLEGQIDEDGQSALTRLREVRKGQDEFSRRLLAMTRHTIAYHYDHGVFEKGLKRLLARYGENSQADLMFIEGRSGHEYYYLALADAVRVESVEGLTGGDGREELDALQDLTRALGTFLESLLKAYGRSNKIDLNFELRG